MSKSRLTALALAAAVCIIAAGASQAATYTYKVSVKTNFNTRFNDCFVFDKGVLTIQTLGTLDYTAAPTTPVHFYTAVVSVKEAEKLGATFAFAGFNSGNAKAGKLHAVGADNHHDSYVVEGEAVASCPISDTSTDTSKWLPKAN